MPVFSRTRWVATACIAASTSATASADGFYGEVSVGAGTLSGEQLVVNEVPGQADVPVEGDGCCPELGFGFGLRVGWIFLGSFAPEAVLVGNGWNLGSDAGGAGFVGGGLRFLPFGLLKELDLELPIPLDLGIGVVFGWSITGKDFAYTGTFLGVDGTLQWRIVDSFALGARLNWIKPMYDDFAYTDYNNSRGRCLDANARQTGAIVSKNDAVCSGASPNTTLLQPELVATFHFAFM